MTNVVFLHGLNTFGDDDLHIGPLRFGPMHRPWENALREKGCDVLPMTGLGTGDPFTQAERALEVLQAAGWHERDRICLIGHSTGGLVARALAARLGHAARAVLTVGTPNAGTSAAELGQALERNLPGVQRLFAFFGYDTRKKTDIYQRFTPAAVAEFNALVAEPASLKRAHALCEAGGEDLSWPLRFFYARLHPRAEDRGHSDGFVLSRSQAWGERLGTYQLDHFGNLGFFFQLGARGRASARREFHQLVNDAVEFMRGAVSN